MSRSIGDAEAERVGVISDPEFATLTLAVARDGKASEASEATAETQSPVPFLCDHGGIFVVLGTDGVWEFLRSSEAAALAAEHRGNAKAAAISIFEEAVARWKENASLQCR